MSKSYPWYVTPKQIKKLAIKLYVERYGIERIPDDRLASQCLEASETFFRVASEVQDGR